MWGTSRSSLFNRGRGERKILDKIKGPRSRVAASKYPYYSLLDRIAFSKEKERKQKCGGGNGGETTTEGRRRTKKFKTRTKEKHKQETSIKGDSNALRGTNKKEILR